MHKSRFTSIRAVAAVVTVSGAVCALPAGASAADQSLSSARVQRAAQQPSTAQTSLVRQESRKAGSSRASLAAWGFNVQLWRYTVADPLGVHRLYYYNKCKPKPGVRFFKMSSSWIYRTYECWAILA